MRILHLTAGTGTWHCGSCIRDDNLVKALRTLGHEADLVPMYLPIVADGVSCSAHEPVWIGGINAYLQQEVPLFRHVPRWMDAVLSTRPFLSLAGRMSGSTRPEELGAMTVSMLEGQHGHQAKEIDRLLDALARRPKPDVVVLSNSLLVGLVAPLKQALDVRVVCTVQGEMHFLDALDEGRDRAWALVSEGLAACDARVAVSAFAADRMATRTGLPREDFDVVHNGIDTRGYGPHAPAEPPVLGFFARLYRAKGLANVAEAYIALRAGGHATLQLAIGGTLNAGDKPDIDAVKARLAAAGVADGVRWYPNLSLQDKQAFLRRLTLFCVPSAKEETFGMYNLEAMASGVPVVAPDRGAVPEVMQAGGGVLVPPDDHGALVALLHDLLGDPARRAALGRAGVAGVQAGFTARHMAEAEAKVLARVVGPA